jgi:hypothetical protein
LLDFPRLKDFYVQSLSLEESVPSQVWVQLPHGRFFEMSHPYPTLIAVLKGNVLRDLYKKHKEALFAWNVCGYLGSRGINAEMSQTAKGDPSHFFYFNNGVAAICTDYTIDADLLMVDKFQIINGAQTVGVLARVEPHPDIEVLFRLTKTNNVIPLLSLWATKAYNGAAPRFTSAGGCSHECAQSAQVDRRLCRPVLYLLSRGLSGGPQF